MTEALNATGNQMLRGTTCRIQAAKQHVHTVLDTVSTEPKTLSRVAHNSTYTPISSHTPSDCPPSFTYASASLQPTQIAPWTIEEDDILCDYRTMGFGWSQIQEKHLPGKSANSCRKWHERLTTKRRSTDWDDTRLENLAVNYRLMRREIWRPLAERLGEKWEHVEKAVGEVAVDVVVSFRANSP